MQIFHLVRQTIARHDLAGPNTRVLAAVSGGSDSVALVHVLKQLDAAGALQLMGVAHFNHQLRPDAVGDERFCSTLAEQLRLPFFRGGDDVTARARREHRSIESAAREARHEFLECTRVGAGADVVALGHTKDDQAETFLLRLIRGAGAAGLSSMHPKIGSIVRPLLDCRRDDLRTFLANRGIPFVEDESNADVTIPRNRIRAELIPLLEQRFNPRVVDVLADDAALARDEWACLNAATDQVWPRMVRQEQGTWRLSVRALRALPRGVARSIVRRAMMLASGRPIRFADVTRVLELDGAAVRIDAPGHRVERRGDDLILMPRRSGHRGREISTAPRFERVLPVPGEVELCPSGPTISVEVGPRSGRVISCTPEVALVRHDRLTNGLVVRNRRPGDRFKPVGLAGRKKLQDFFVDKKVARDARDQVPLVVDGQDRIVWVAGYALDEDFRVTDPAQPMLILRLKAVGGSF